jgi:hypothetical protein
VHSAINAVANGKLRHNHTDIRKSVIAELLEQAKHSTTICAILKALGLELNESSILTPARLADSVRVAFELSERRRDEATIKEPKSTRSHSASIFGSEVRLSSNRLDLAGRADSISTPDDTTVLITDFKTGNAARQTGQLRQEYWVQVGCYAWMVLEIFPDHAIILRIVAADGVWEEEFTAHFANEIEDYVRVVSNLIPAGAKSTASELANPGSGCARCRFRPSCSEYKLWAAPRWSGQRGELPLDTWGIVVSIQERSDRLSDLRLADVSGRCVRILAFPDTLLVNQPQAGDRLEMYELKSSETTGNGAFPRNFYLANAVHPYASAFSAVALCSWIVPRSFP